MLNAKSVELDPPVEPVHPAVGYCFNVAPPKTTTYTLKVKGKNGHVVEKQLTIEVKEP